jgi:sulfate adenylyltransferase subunit 2
MPFLNVDTGHHFPELNEFRDRRAKQLGAKLIVRTVEDAIAKGIATPAPGEISRNRCRSRPCSPPSRSSASTAASAAPGATRKRPAPRSASSVSATASASGTPRTSAPRSGISTTPALNPGENMRVFPLSNWTEMDVWEYIKREQLEVPSIYFSHRANASAAAASGCPVQPSHRSQAQAQRR